MLCLMGFSGSLPLYYLLLLDIICSLCISWANTDACLLACLSCVSLYSTMFDSVLTVSYALGQ